MSTRYRNFWMLPTIVWCFFSGPASATLVNYIWEGSVSGSLDGNAFTNEPFVLTLAADTANIAPFSNGIFVLNDSATIAILNQTLTISTPTTTNLNDDFDGITFGNDEVQFDILLLFTSALDGYDLASPLGPLVIAPPDTFISSAGTPLSTSGGNLQIASDAAATLTFTAVAVPEASSAVLVGGLAAAVGLRLRRRRDGSLRM